MKLWDPHLAEALERMQRRDAAPPAIDWQAALVIEPAKPVGGCDHGVAFDASAARGLTAAEVQRRWPRGWGPCPKGCGYAGIAYASYEHYIAGDW